MKTLSNPESGNSSQALILGATGGVGGAVAEALAARGWHVRALVRDPVKAAASWHQRGGRIEWIAGDAMVRDDVVAAASGVQAIVHAVNPPGYRDWDKVVLPMIDNTIAAARAAGGARILLPGTIYNFDAASTPVVRDNSPQSSRSRKGKIRVELERRLQAASAEAPALIVRAGDFFGPNTRSSWFSQAMVKPGRPVRRIMSLSRNVGHSWAYLPDLADAMARLLEHRQLRPFERVGFEGYWDSDGKGFPALVAAAIGRTHIPAIPFPWWLFRLLSPFGGFPREAADIEGVWRHPMRIENDRMRHLLGFEPRTCPLQAMSTTLESLGCMPPTAPGISAPLGHR